VLIWYTRAEAEGVDEGREMSSW